eukprot:GFUD01095066.1.p1 GENE.GFUD01095066.1~~GFUD01095066.1.p1  ORF type:complete len:123 (+),score=1.13 GFUD01095066.1:23-391(+)
MGPRHLLLLATLCLQDTALDAQTTPIIGPNPLQVCPLPSMPCPNIGVDINCLRPWPCNNACFENVTSWEACASQCSGFNMKDGIDKGYIACKNDVNLSQNFPFYRSSSIMGTARCLGAGRTY